MKKLFTVLIFTIVLSSCQSNYQIFVTSPERYTNEDISVEYIIGHSIFTLRVHNNSDEEIFIDTNRLSFVSTKGEVVALNPSFKAVSVLAGSYIDYHSYELIFFDRTRVIESGYDYLPWEIRKMEEKGVEVPESGYLSGYKGDSIKLFIPYTINGEEKKPYFEIKLKDVIEVQEITL